MRLDEGAVFEGYRIDALLDDSGVDEVYRVTHLDLDRPMVLRIFDGLREPNDEGFSQPSPMATRLTGIDPAELSGIAMLHESGISGGNCWVSSELAPGVALSRMLADRGPLPTRAVAAVVSAAVDSLEPLHARGIVHNDLGPHCIYVDESAHDLRVTIAGLDSYRLLRIHSRGATLPEPWPHFPAPHANPEPRDCRDPRQDQFALACTAYEMLTGQGPFGPHSFVVDLAPIHVWRTLDQPAPSAARVRGDLPNWFDFTIRRAMAKDPTQRFDSCRSFADTLRDGPDTYSDEYRDCPEPLLDSAPTGFRICLPTFYPHGMSMGITGARVDDPGAEILGWHVDRGSLVRRGDALFSVEVRTGGGCVVQHERRIVFSPVAGTVLDIRVPQARGVHAGEQLAVIGTGPVDGSHFGLLPMLIPGESYIRRTG